MVMTTQSRHLLFAAHTNSDNVDGAISTLLKFESEGYTPTVAMRNSILSAIARAPELQYETVLSSCFEFYWTGLHTADIATYQLALSACEKYGRADDAVTWFDHLVSSGLKVTTVALDTLHRTVGDTAFEECKSRLPSDVRQVIQSVGQVTPIEVTANAMKTEVTKNILSREHVLHKPKAAVAIPRIKKKWTASIDKLKDLGRRGDVAGVQILIDTLQPEGSIPKSLLLEHLVYAHMKALDTKGAQEVVNSMKVANVDVSRRSYQHLIHSYSNDGDGAGAEKVVLEALMSGHATGE